MEPTNDSSHGGSHVGIFRILWRHFNLVVVTCIIALAMLLGILNNLRVADERKVKWFDAPADRADLETTEEATP